MLTVSQRISVESEAYYSPVRALFITILNR